MKKLVKKIALNLLIITCIFCVSYFMPKIFLSDFPGFQQFMSLCMLVAGYGLFYAD